ncbi:hypothetical protein GCM10023222_37770 [Saccharopolyspora cebuensis]
MRCAPGHLPRTLRPGAATLDARTKITSREPDREAPSRDPVGCIAVRCAEIHRRPASCTVRHEWARKRVNDRGSAAREPAGDGSRPGGCGERGCPNGLFAAWPGESGHRIFATPDAATTTSGDHVMFYSYRHAGSCPTS